MSAPTPKSRTGGFSLPEVMVVVAIMALLAAMAAPSMSTMIKRQRIKTAAFDVFSSMAFSRSEAVKRNTSVTLTPTNSDWAQGWSIADANGNVLRNQSGWDTITVTGPATVTFLSSGRVASNATPFQLAASGVETEAKRCVTLDLSGRAVSKEGIC